MIIASGTFFKLFGDGIAPGSESGEFAQPFDRRVLLALARTLRPAAVVEFGVQRGLTAALLLTECPWIRRYVGIDLPEGALPVQAGQAQEVPEVPGELASADPRFELLRADSALVTPDMLPTADMVYIDGGHDYPHVVADLRLARAIVRPGGVIAWHDYHRGEPGVRQAIDECNQAEGDHIALVDGSWVCFELRREGREDQGLRRAAAPALSFADPDGVLRPPPAAKARKTKGVAR
jgi:predicted O-methyltransferase YrrM